MFKGSPELIFQKTVHPLDLLFFPQLNGIFGVFAPALPVLPGRIIPSIDGALVGITTVPFQKHLHIFSAA
jgi:hypothetical protein